MLQTQIRSKACKLKDHYGCAGRWTGLGIDVTCDCKCHETKNAGLRTQPEPQDDAAATISVRENGNYKERID